ncbi:hypothetical protein MITS9509_01629 [Synechococcus sp. MIT S9509]|uniref:UPF0182 family protein n=1 Tax=unclassified Synechococcus TaxID=2626047 RepID=UPI0007BBDF4E|nr:MULTISPECIES: UPF0182 family protein [unclassified Synechococcus]KZR88045.1 hypothetical protein MITS9504_00471 [Synechococcus sp. MIT S9504]KZR92170.1 hypothetical protein MITS9509_01629 [Synechococcus sp. MIT S9509]
MSLLKRGLPFLLSRSAVWLLLAFPAFWLFARLQVEWSWFSQFGHEGIYLQRLGFQVLGAGLALLLVLLTAWWRHRWMRAYVPTPRGEIPALRGGVYSLSLLACLSILLSVLAITTRLAWLAWKQPFLLAHWWSVPFQPEWTVLIISILLILLITIGLGRRRRINLAFLYGSLCICVVAGRSWGLWALAITIPDAGSTDPLLGADLSFGLGRFSAIALVLELLLLQILLTLSTSAWSRLTRPPCLSDWGFPGWNTQERALLRPVLALLLLVLAALTWLVRHQLLWTQSGLVAGAGWLDIHLRLPLRQCVALLLVLMAGTFVPWPGERQFPRRRLRTALFTLALVAVLAELLLSPIVQWIVVRPKELQLETPYISRSISATRQAYQLDSIKARGSTPTQEISEQDLVKGASTLQNIRLWDSQPMLDTNRQLQQLRVYYQFANASVDRYPLHEEINENQQVIISARELDQAALPKRSRTWQNRHFVFTHGFGFTLNPVNTREPDGLPAYFISDLGQSTQIQGNESLGISKEDVEREVPIGRAALYFGALHSPYAVAPTRIEEFDYPEGDDNTYNHYSGSAGVSLEHQWQRITAATYLGDPRFLNTGALTTESRLLLRRDVKERVRTLAPFLDLMGDPYLVSVPIDDAPSGYQQSQHQYWIVDGFTSSRTVPYAATLPDGRPLRYLRNSVKAVVDAYNGTVHLYINEPNDPIIQAWGNVFPSLFESLQEMPANLKRHLMVPKAQFELQVQQLLRYHVTNPRIFYSGDDVWQVPMELYGKNQVPVAPYRITAQIKQSPSSEFLLLQPLTPLARPNLSAWLAARNDGEHYGELVLLRFPSDVPIFGPEQVQALINQNPEISQQFALWDRAGSQVVQGNLLVVPVGDSLLYVEPIYLRARQGGLPTLTRIVVSDGRRVAMAADLDNGLTTLLNKRRQETKETP